MDCNPPGSSVHGLLQAKILEWVAISSSMESSPPGIEPASLLSPVLAGGFLEGQVGKIELRTGKELLKNTFDILCLTASRLNSCGLVPSRFSSVQFSSSVVSNSLQHHWLQHDSHPCPSSTPRAYSNSRPSSHWCHPTISSSVFPFSSHLQSFPASGSFPKSQFFNSGGQTTGVSAWVSVLPMNIQDRFPLEFTGLISSQSKGLARVFSNTTVQKRQFFSNQLSL